MLSSRVSRLNAWRLHARVHASLTTCTTTIHTNTPLFLHCPSLPLSHYHSSTPALLNNDNNSNEHNNSAQQQQQQQQTENAKKLFHQMFQNHKSFDDSNDDHHAQYQKQQKQQKEIQKVRELVGDLTYSDLERLAQNASDLVELSEDCLSEDHLSEGITKATRAIDLCGMIHGALLRIVLSDRLRDGMSDRVRRIEALAHLNRAICMSLHQKQHEQQVSLQRDRQRRQREERGIIDVDVDVDDGGGGDALPFDQSTGMIKHDPVDIHREFQKSLELDGVSNPMAYYSYAVHLIGIGQADLSFVYLNRAIEMNPHEPLAYLRRAEARTQVLSHDHRRTFVSSDPVGSQNDHVSSSSLSTQLNEIMSDCTIAIQNGCDDPYVFYWRANAILLNLGRPESDNGRFSGKNWTLEQALNDLTTAVKVGGHKSHKILYLRAVCLASKTKLTEAINNLYAARLVLDALSDSMTEEEYVTEVYNVEKCLEDVQRHAKRAGQTIPKRPQIDDDEEQEEEEE